jgi:hypothetical protein
MGGGMPLRAKYNGSISLLLSNLYPEYDWLPWRFTFCPQSYWNDLKNQRKFVEWAGNQLNIKEMSDWYKVTTRVTRYH